MAPLDPVDFLYRTLHHCRERNPSTLGRFEGDDFGFLSFAARHASKSRAQVFQDLWVLYELGEKKNGYFVEFGSTDGLNISNSWLLETEYDWTGALAEPHTLWHESLFRNRKSFISTDCIYSASGLTVEFNQTALPEFSTVRRFSDSDGHAARRENGNIVAVQTISLGDFLKEANAPTSVDYMSVDTEGSEYEILRTFDFGSYDIRLITVEHNFTPQREALHELLNLKGYKRKFERFSQWDDWYVKCS